MLHQSLASVLVLLWIPAVVLGLQCFQCQSLKTMDDCLKQKKAVTCKPNQDRCGTVTYGGIHTMDCFASNECKTARTAFGCKTDGSNGQTCNRTSCCIEDFCNIGRLEPPSRVPTVKPGLKCHKCSGAESWRDCFRKQTEETCSSDQDHCMKLFLLIPTKKRDLKIYAKGCASASNCQESTGVCQATSTKQGTSTCEVSCCSSDYCNLEKTQTCYECASFESMAECEERQTFVTCHAHKNRCANRAVTQGSYSQFLKYCATKADCEEDICARRSSPDCRLRCCEEPDCNRLSRAGMFTLNNVAVLAYAAALVGLR